MPLRSHFPTCPRVVGRSHIATGEFTDKTNGEQLASLSMPRVERTTFGGRFQTYFRASAHAHFLRVYLKNHLSKLQNVGQTFLSAIDPRQECLPHALYARAPDRAYPADRKSPFFALLYLLSALSS
jgi:hypothetical protein